jgi:cyclic dehypoxanthinyl futalosine synthase
LRLLVNYMDKNLLQLLACCAVDDIGGTSLDEKIAKATGAPGDAAFSSKEEMYEFIRKVDLEPVFVNSRYELLGDVAVDEPVGAERSVSDINMAGRLSLDDAAQMYDELSFTELGALASRTRFERVPGSMATYVVDRNISLTNICVSGCEFCAFYVDAGSDRAFTLSREEVLQKVKEAVAAGATQIMVQGGLNPELNIEYYEGLFRAIKETADVWIHSLTATEIHYLAKQTDLSYSDVLKRLVAAGLDSLPGGGAEILVDRIRQKVSPKKTTSSQWLEVMETAHGMGLRSTATMVYGLGETTRERMDHLCKIRDLQDRTGGFTAFIPWSFQSGHTRLDLPGSTGVDYLKVVSIARLVLDNVDHVQAGWVTEGPDLAQLALVFGADDFGGVLMEEQVVKATGISHQVTEQKVRHLISDVGLLPRKRTTLYELTS